MALQQQLRLQQRTRALSTIWTNRFHHGFHARQPRLELTTNHFVHVQEKRNRLGNELF
jgi:hypothetical protein